MVGILSPGEMGAAVGWVLREHGLRVVTCLQGRGEWTLSRAQEAGIQDLPSYDELISEADIILSILPPAQALAVAGSAADAVRRTGAHVVYVDCNAIAPQTVRKVAHIVKQSGAEYIDAGIIGGPPSREHGPHIYASGPNAQSLEVLRSYGLDVRVMGDGIDQASSLKMVYAASTKGLGALVDGADRRRRGPGNSRCPGTGDWGRRAPEQKSSRAIHGRHGPEVGPVRR